MITAALLFVASNTGLAATLTVTNLNDTGSGSLRQTILNAGPDDTIVFSVTGTITLTSGQMFITKNLTISGPGPGSLTVARSTANGTANFRIFTTQSGSNLAISGLTLANGSPGGHGGAIYANFQESAATTLTIDNCVFNGNQGDYGGAIFNDGFNDPSFPAHTATLTVTNSTFSNNIGSQYGGAIWNESGGIVMNVSNCTFSKNKALARSAGAIQFDGSSGTATGSITNCTFTGNTAANYGGAVNIDGQGGFDANGNPANGSATLTVTNCTFDQNSANWGGGIAMDGSNGSGSTGNATVKVSNCTFKGNSATTLGGGLYLSQTGAGTTSLQIGNTIVKAGAKGANFTIDNMSGGTAAIASQGYNLSSDAAGGGAGTAPGGFLNHSGDIRNTDPLLDPAGLQSNGGVTQTIALQATSPALDQGRSNTISPTNNDQRGEPRPFDDPNVANAAGGDGSDIGAYEADVRIIAQNKVGVGFNDLQLTFTTILAHNYEIQHASSPAGPWTQVSGTTPPPPIAGTGGIVQVTVTNAFSPNSPNRQFYRVHQLP